MIDIVSDWDMPQAVNGLGTVHHVAMAVATGRSNASCDRISMRLGLQVTDIRDRCYFESIYFREPGGVLFEVATVDPGFSSTSPAVARARSEASAVGRAVRAEIQRGLPAVTLPTT